MHSLKCIQWVNPFTHFHFVQGMCLKLYRVKHESQGDLWKCYGLISSRVTDEALSVCPTASGSGKTTLLQAIN